MTIGFDGSRAFTDNRTGTENYSFQILRHLAAIDPTNQYIVYLRPNQKIVLSYRHPELVSGSRSRNKFGMTTLNQDQNDKNKMMSLNTEQRTLNEDNHGWPSNFKFKTINYPRLWTQLGLAVQTFLDPLDVLFVTAHTIPLIHRPGLRTVMVAHDLGAEYLPGMHQLKQRIYLNFITNFQFKSATRVIAVSQATKKDLIAKAGVSPQKISVIYEGIDQQFSDPPTKSKIAQTLQKYNLKEQAYFFFLGTIQPRKNLINLITAFSQFLTRHPEFISGSRFSQAKTEIPKQVRDDKIKLVIAGSKGWKSDQIYSLPKQLGIKDRVIFTGRISDDEAKCLYSSAIAFTFPSLFEGFGLPILEAFAMDCPVITSNTSSMPEVAGDAAILINPTNVDQISSALSEITDSKLRQKLIAKGSIQLKKFSWRKAAQETLKVLEETTN